MFSGIAKRYDLLNHVLSLNIDKSWRRKVRKELDDVLSRKDAVVLDVACGTGDLTFELAKGAAAGVIGTDFCRPMLVEADRKAGFGNFETPFVEADAMSLAFPDASFDAVTIAFGLRNLPNFANGLREFFRILKPGGRLVVLEFSAPQVPGMRALFNLYFTQVLPRIGGAVSGSRGAYEYLPDSVSKFPSQIELVELIESVGFDKVSYRNVTGGIAAIHAAAKPI